MTDRPTGRVVTELRNELREAQETLSAIRSSHVDALILGLPGEERVFSLAGADRPYRLLVEAMHEGAATVSTGGTILYANARLGELVGRTADQVVGTSATDLAANSDRDTLAALLAVGVGEHAEAEIELVSPEGVAVCVLLSVVGFELDNTLLRSLVATDLTARRQEEQKLQESEFFFRESQRAAFIGSYRADFAADHWTSSEVLDQIFGIDESYPRTIGSWRELIHPNERARLRRYLDEDVIEGRKPFRMEYRIVRPNDGETRWVSGLGEVRLDPDGNVVGLTGTIMDVTERRSAEEQYRRLFAAIQYSAESVVIANLAGEIEYVNPAFERVTGYSRDEVLGRNPRILKSGVQGPEFYVAMWETLVSGRSFSATITNRRKDGTLIEEETVISPILDESGAINSYVAIKRDVTRERAAEALHERLARERVLIADTLRGLGPRDSAEATAQAICRQVLSLTGVTAAQLFVFEFDGRATPLGFTVAGEPDPPLRRLPSQRSRHLRERAAEGPWIEPWVNRPWHPYNKLFSSLGVHLVAYAPVRWDGTLIGLLVIDAGPSATEAVMTESLAALVEFADLAAALIGREVADRTETRATRERIRAIIRRSAFQPVFQPIVEVETGAYIGYEALTRFTDGQRPDLVFAEARVVDLEAELELATLAIAIEAAAALPRTTWLSLNVSPALAVEGPRLGRLLRKADRPLVLEITEHVPVDDYDALRTALARLRPKVRVAVDDTGAGVANLSHIAELRPAFVKLDVSLIRGIDTDLTRQALIVGLLHFAAESGSTAIAEGVESQEELAMLRELGVPLVQGYLLARPAPVAEWMLPDEPRLGKPRLRRSA